MISNDPNVCLFDSADGTLCTYRNVCGQRTSDTICIGMADAEAAWAALPPDVQAKYSSDNTGENP